MAGGVADVLKIVVLAACADAALRRCRAIVGAHFIAEKQILELHHAGIGEQQGGIIGGHQRTAGHDLMSLGIEVVQKLLANIGNFHRLFQSVVSLEKARNYTLSGAGLQVNLL